jgi:hypothetical protein
MDLTCRSWWMDVGFVQKWWMIPLNMTFFSKMMTFHRQATFRATSVTVTPCGR